MSETFLTALPVYNEAAHVRDVLAEVRRYSTEVLVVDDGSTDETPRILAECEGVRVVRHAQNSGYGAALKTAFDYALREGFEVLVTIDCDGQHAPQRIPRFVEACEEDDVDIVSGSRYLRPFAGDSQPPEARRRVNRRITDELNRLLDLELTDAFCGFKAYRTPGLAKLQITEPGYAMPLQVWVQAAHAGLRIKEAPVPLIYLEEERSFGGSLDDANTRLKYYEEVIRRNLAAIGAKARRSTFRFAETPPYDSQQPGPPHTGAGLSPIAGARGRWRRAHRAAVGSRRRHRASQRASAPRLPLRLSRPQPGTSDFKRARRLAADGLGPYAAVSRRGRTLGLWPGVLGGAPTRDVSPGRMVQELCLEPFGARSRRGGRQSVDRHRHAEIALVARAGGIGGGAGRAGDLVRSAGGGNAV